MSLFKFLKNFDFGRNFRKSSKNVDFSQIFEKFRFWQIFENFRFWSNFRKIWISVKFLKKSLILVMFWKKVRFWSNFRKCGFFFGNFEKFIFVKFSKKFRFWSIIYERHRFFREFGKFRFCQNFRKKFSIWSKLAKISKNVDFSQIFEKFRFWS